MRVAAARYVAEAGDAPEPAPAGRLPLRFIACGSVDDGKSTLLGRLLHDAGAVADDHGDVLADESRRFGTTGDEPDFALLLDGLEAEREQGITIDVAYRYFATPRRKFIVADTPGHEQYTRNMVTGASMAELAIILVDAERGITRQTRRHSSIVHALGIREVVLAVNKMDLAGFDRSRFEAIAADYGALAARIGIAAFIAIPVAARSGDNVVRRGARMGWYGGPTLLEALEGAAAHGAPDDAPFAMPVQRVARPDAAFRGYAGRIAAGRLRPGDEVRVLPSGTSATIARIVAPGADRADAGAGESVMVTFAEQVDCARGDVIVARGSTVRAASAMEASLIWLDRAPLDKSRRYLLKLGTRTVGARVTDVRERFDPATGETHAAAGVGVNDIALCRLALERPVALDSYERSRALGGFILIDPTTNATIAAGLVRSADDAPPAGSRAPGRLYRVDADPGDAEQLGAKAAEMIRAGGAPALTLDTRTIAVLRDAATRGEAAVRDALVEIVRAAGVAVVLADGDARAPGEPLTAVAIDGGLGGDWVI